MSFLKGITLAAATLSLLPVASALDINLKTNVALYWVFVPVSH
jgi:hypothetical protein